MTAYVVISVIIGILAFLVMAVALGVFYYNRDSSVSYEQEYAQIAQATIKITTVPLLFFWAWPVLIMVAPVWFVYLTYKAWRYKPEAS